MRRHHSVAHLDRPGSVGRRSRTGGAHHVAGRRSCPRGGDGDHRDRAGRCGPRGRRRRRAGARARGWLEPAGGRRRVPRHRRTGRHPRHRRGRLVLQRGHGDGRGRGGLGCVRGERGRTGVERYRGPVRHSRPGRRHADPERRRVRERGRPDHRPGPDVRPFDRAPGELLGRGLRFRLPHLPVQGRTRSPSGAGGHLPVHPRLVVGTRPVRRAGPHPRGAGRHAGARGRRPAGGARPAGRQGDGAGRDRPRHLERRLVLHQPDPGP